MRTLITFCTLAVVFSLNAKGLTGPEIVPDSFDTEYQKVFYQEAINPNSEFILSYDAFYQARLAHENHAKKGRNYLGIVVNYVEQQKTVLYVYDTKHHVLSSKSVLAKNPKGVGNNKMIDLPLKTANIFRGTFRTGSFQGKNADSIKFYGKDQGVNHNISGSILSQGNKLGNAESFFLPSKNYPQILETLKDGAVIFVYSGHPKIEAEVMAEMDENYMSLLAAN